MGIRVYKLAEKLGIESNQLLDKLKDLNVNVKSHMSSLDEETAEIVIEELKDQESIKKLREEKKEKDAKPVLEISFPITVKQLAKKISYKPSDFIQKLMRIGILANINQSLDRKILDKIGEELGYEIRESLSAEEEVLKMHDEQKDKSEDMIIRPPVVTFMGHVDHGKTSLLELIKESDLTKREFGGITQHIGAYQIKVKNNYITFLDTPGHEAFTSLRARGAHVTDLVILVIAADDGVMPQTVEAIHHARAAKVPIIVALNKIDKANADPEKVKKQLAEYDLTPEDWGGKTITVETSAETKQGIKELLDMILLESELLQLKSNPRKPAQGIVIEAQLCKGKGPLANILVQSGTLNIEDIVVAGRYYGKIKALINDAGKNIKKALPSTPVEILGLSGTPDAGEKFFVVIDELTAKQIVASREKKEQSQKIQGPKHVSLEDLHNRIQAGKINQLNLIIKADVQGSLEALVDLINKIQTEEIKINIIHKAVGLVKDSDIMLAAASDAIVIAFHIGISNQAVECAKREGVDVRKYNVIYKAIEEIKASIEGMLEPEDKEVKLGAAEIRQVFDVSKTGKIAGCYVTEGKVTRNAMCKLYRDDKIIYEGKINSLKRFKQDVSEVKKDYECGIGIEGCNDIKKDDIIQVFQIEKILKKL